MLKFLLACPYRKVLAPRNLVIFLCFCVRVSMKRVGGLYDNLGALASLLSTLLKWCLILFLNLSDVSEIKAWSIWRSLSSSLSRLLSSTVVKSRGSAFATWCLISAWGIKAKSKSNKRERRRANRSVELSSLVVILIALWSVKILYRWFLDRCFSLTDINVLNWSPDPELATSRNRV